MYISQTLFNKYKLSHFILLPQITISLCQVDYEFIRDSAVFMLRTITYLNINKNESIAEI